MSTDRKMRSPQGKLLSSARFAQLARLGEVVFHTDDLANLWHITSKNTLYTTLKRYTQQRLIYRIYKGFYAIKPPQQINPYLLGVKAIHSLAYVSTETILAKFGIIAQVLPAITLVSRQTKRFSAAGINFYSRALTDQFLHQPIGIFTTETGVRQANVERAVADLLYFNPQAYLDAPSRVDWKQVKKLQKTIGYSLTPQRYD